LIHAWIVNNKIEIKDPELFNKFDKCTNMDKNSLKRVYDDIKLLMFNNKDIVKNQIKN
jgi:hypothetical protein